MIISFQMSSFKIPVSLVSLQSNLNFINRLWKILKYPVSSNDIRPVGGEVLHADRQRADGQKEEHDEANGCVLKFYDRA